MTRKRGDDHKATATEESLDAITDALLTASRLLVGISARSIARVDETITIPQFRTLVILSNRGPINLATLANLLGVQPSAAPNGGRLVGAGLVDRQPTPRRGGTAAALTPADVRWCERSPRGGAPRSPASSNECRRRNVTVWCVRSRRSPPPGRAGRLPRRRGLIGRRRSWRRPYTVPVRLVFAGTPETALPALRRLIDSPRHDVVAVLTPPMRRPAPRQAGAVAVARRLSTLASRCCGAATELR
ncbi:marR family protein [Mycobacterium xenopi 4042]|uniref:MarR family protein n=1 Tax=Mycobacterium xenopi 4042 TaxID=1299334 RepID=X7ZG35_MYCXE|nr:marR family protein [Mycobacterium xenopi 4042]